MLLEHVAQQQRVCSGPYAHRFLIGTATAQVVLPASAAAATAATAEAAIAMVSPRSNVHEQTSHSSSCCCCRQGLQS